MQNRGKQPQGPTGRVRRLSAAITLAFACSALGTGLAQQLNPTGAPDELSWSWHTDGQSQAVLVTGPGGVVSRLARGGEGDGGRSVTVESGEIRRVLVVDAENRLLEAEGDGGKLSIRRRPDGLPAEARMEGAPTLLYSYDALGRLTELQIGKAAAIRYRYDYLGRLAAVSTPAGDVSYDYQPASNLVTRRLPNGWRTIRKHDDENRLTELTHVDASSRIVAQYRYTYRPDGLIGTISEANARDGERTFHHQYDLMKRLTAVRLEGQGRSHRYRYDPLGNLAEWRIDDEPALLFSSTPAGALAGDTRTGARVDQRGHVRQLPGALQPIDYEFNEMGELSAALGGRLRYDYNALGLLVSRVLDGSETRYLPDPFADAWRPIWKRAPSGTESVLVWDGGSPLIELRGKQAVFRLEDHLGGVRVEVKGDGGIAAWREYSPYGAPARDLPEDGLSPGFAGLFWDPQARVYLTAARAYDPVTARFLQPDPRVRIPDASKHSHSLYAYCGGDPVNFVDQNGAEARETVTFNASQRWWDSFSRALNFQFWAPFRRLFLPKNMQSPLAVNTDPDIRRSAVQRVIDEAWEQSGHDYYKAWTIAKQWRDKPASRPMQCQGGSCWGQFGDLTAQELKTAENYLYGRNIRETGIVVKGKIELDEPLRGPFSFVADFYWRASHFVGEPMGIAPWVFNPWVRDSEWLVDTSEAHYWRRKSEIDAERGTPIHEATVDVRPPSLLQRISDFFVTPAYPAEIPEAPSAGAPSPVGGVYLGGAGELLEELGRIDGVSVDEETGHLVLIGSRRRPVDLPGLRLRDVVTVFRAVFDHGRAPSVTLDPDPRNPTGPRLLVKHGPGTEGTYVGWVLYECDRIMKTYQLGYDNISREPVQSQVPGFLETLDAVYFGGFHGGVMEAGGWERFWIVPALLRRYDTSGLSLFDIPLKVNTQKMRWKGGELEDDETGESSAGAKAFQAWFTENYDRIADETLVQPPPGSGLTEPVAVFRELKRIAVIAAVAERLRDLGQSLPPWMRDYPVEPFPVPETTPSLSIEKRASDGAAIRVVKVYGGVNLAPRDEDVRVYGEQESASKVSPAASRTLAAKIQDLTRGDQPPGSVQTVATPDGRPVSLAFVPGAETRALGPNRLQVADMTVPFGLGRGIALVRRYNSFFDPDGEYGAGWTLNLPRLLTTQVPVRRDGKHTRYSLVPHLVTPLGDLDIRFDQFETVQPHGVKMAVSKSHPGILGVSRGANKIGNSETRQILFRDGRVWHFDEDGRLKLAEAEGGAVRYIHDDAGRLRQILGYLGGDAVAEIRLELDSKGRITRAVSDQSEIFKNQAPASASEVIYHYGRDGRLAKVTRHGDGQSLGTPSASSYVYDSSRLTKVSSQNGPDVSFDYDARGRLLREKRGGRTSEFKRGGPSDAMTFTIAGDATEAESKSESEQWTYDSRLRPVELKRADGETIRWRYGLQPDGRSLDEGGGNVWETRSNRGRPITRQTGPDGGLLSLESADGSRVEARQDASGRPTALLLDGTEAARLSWRPDGSLAGVTLGQTEIRLRRHQDGRPSGVLISGPFRSGKTDRWLEEEWDVMGRPVRITDSSGLKLELHYDRLGRPYAYGRVVEDGLLRGYKLTYDDTGRVIRVDSSQGAEERQYSDSGNLLRVERQRLGARSVTTFDGAGRPVSETGFDGGSTVWTYPPADSGVAPQWIDLPDGQRIEYAWESAAPKAVRLGPALIKLKSQADGRVTSLAWARATP